MGYKCITGHHACTFTPRGSLPNSMLLGDERKPENQEKAHLELESRRIDSKLNSGFWDSAGVKWKG